MRLDNTVFQFGFAPSIRAAVNMYHMALLLQMGRHLQFQVTIV